MPDLSGAIAWLNSAPLTRDSLRGKVVVIDFWTYSCINCLRALPYVEGVGGEIQGCRPGGDRRAYARIRV